MIAPEPAVAPVMPPVIFPTVHVKVLGIEAPKIIFEIVPLHIMAVLGTFTTGVGLTVTVTGNTPQLVEAEGFTRYSTLPTIKLLGLVSV